VKLGNPFNNPVFCDFILEVLTIERIWWFYGEKRELDSKPTDGRILDVTRPRSRPRVAVHHPAIGDGHGLSQHH